MYPASVGDHFHLICACINRSSPSRPLHAGWLWQYASFLSFSPSTGGSVCRAEQKIIFNSSRSICGDPLSRCCCCIFHDDWWEGKSKGYSSFLGRNTWVGNPTLWSTLRTWTQSGSQPERRTVSHSFTHSQADRPTAIQSVRDPQHTGQIKLNFQTEHFSCSCRQCRSVAWVGSWK